jgi:hypothetical protein
MKRKARLVIGCGFLALVGCALQAQKAEVFSGYQYMRPDGGPNSNGWNAALTGNFKQDARNHR